RTGRSSAAAASTAAAAKTDTKADANADTKTSIIRIHLTLTRIRSYAARFERIHIQILKIVLKFIHLSSLRYMFM
ncbi:hypothetical protein BN871_HJ_00060, partial [Paenibacillus sp. P22]